MCDVRCCSVGVGYGAGGSLGGLGGVGEWVCGCVLVGVGVWVWEWQVGCVCVYVGVCGRAPSRGRVDRPKTVVLITIKTYRREQRSTIQRGKRIAGREVFLTLECLLKVVSKWSLSRSLSQFLRLRGPQQTPLPADSHKS